MIHKATTEHVVGPIWIILYWKVVWKGDNAELGKKEQKKCSKQNLDS